MNRNWKKLSAKFSPAIILLTFTCLICVHNRCEAANKPFTLSEYSSQKPPARKSDTPYQFLPDVHASINGAAVKGEDYTARVSRKIEFDFLKIQDLFLHFSFNEENLFETSATQLDHEFRYLGIGYETPTGRIAFFWDHTCYNPNRKRSSDTINQIHWNELGIGYQTRGFMPGHKNEGLVFNSSTEWLNTVHWSVSLSRIIMKSENDYQWMGKVGFRDDLLRIADQVFFCQFGFTSIYDDDRDITLDSCLQIGDRIVFHSDKSFCLTPFVSYQHFHDWYAEGRGVDLFYAGLSLEMNMNPKNQNTVVNQKKPYTQWAPQLFIEAGYANFIQNKNYGHKSDVAIDLAFLTLNASKTLSLFTYAGILTLPHDLNPYLTRYTLGPSLTIDLDAVKLRLFHSYSTLYGVEYENFIRDYHLVGLMLKEKNASCWKWDLQMGFYPASRKFDYWGNLQGSLGYCFLQTSLTPSILFSGHYLQGSPSVFGHALEAGIKIPGQEGNLNIYLCIQDDFDIFRFGKGSQNFFGIRFIF